MIASAFPVDEPAGKARVLTRRGWVGEIGLFERLICGPYVRLATSLAAALLS